jgi:hypothetical protein
VFSLFLVCFGRKHLLGEVRNVRMLRGLVERLLYLLIKYVGKPLRFASSRNWRKPPAILGS